MILLKAFIKLNINTDTMIKNVSIVELNTNVVTVFFFFFDCINFKDDLIKYKFFNKNHENFLMMT